jgi:hypothetical protein
MVLEQPWAPNVKSSGLVYADPGFDRLPALGNGAESSGGLRTPPAKWEAQSHSDAGVISTDFCAMIVHRAKFKSCYS